MNEELAHAFRAVERYSWHDSLTHDDNIDSVVQNLATIIMRQQQQIDKLQNKVGLLVAALENATLEDNS